MTIKQTSKSLIFFIIIFSFLCCENKDKKKLSNISVEFSQVYELSNIILSLTEYGTKDRWQVQKGYPYYDEVRSYFESMMNHPILDSVNFSKKTWKQYLSYRTDAYAFKFSDADSTLFRHNDFYSFNIKTFDKYLQLTQDFADKSNFRSFYNNHKEFYNKLVIDYNKQYMIDEVKDFLITEFGNVFVDKDYKIIISPFVYAQNLHRNIDSVTTADFVPIAKPILLGKPMSNRDKAIQIHTLFTEINHGYVNPISDKNKKLIDTSFDEKRWSLKNGYWGKDNAVFNEYMTWSIYDIFLEKYFPNYAEEIGLMWHFQNESRGFEYSYLFSKKLKQIYEKKDKVEALKDLYPKLLSWTRKVQKGLSKPKVKNEVKSFYEISNDSLRLEIDFTESLLPISEFDIIVENSLQKKDTVFLGLKNKIKWNIDNNKVSFTLKLKLKEKDSFNITLNRWGVKKPLLSQKGILLKPMSLIKFKNE